MDDIDKSIINTLKLKLKSVGYDYDKISHKEQQYLCKIESIITESFDNVKKFKEVLKLNTINTKFIATRAKMSRQTIYNNPMFKTYIDYRTIDYNDLVSSYDVNNKKAEINQLKEEIKALHVRDVEIMELKRSLAELKKKIIEKDEIIAILKSNNSEKILLFTKK